MADIRNSFALNMKKLRKKNGLTQLAVAEKIGCSEKAVSKWERGLSIPDIEILLILADLFRVKVEAFFRTDEKVYFLGLDGGGTKTRLQLTDMDGNIIRDITKDACNPIDIGAEKAKEILKSAIYDVCDGIELSSVVLFAGIAGGTSGGMKSVFESFFDEFNFMLFENDTDNKNIITAGLGDKNGITLILGTGVCAYRQMDGNYTMAGGKGYLIDNGGSAYNIGRDGINAYYAEADGYGEKTLITDEIEKEYGKDKQMILGEIYEGGKKKIASFATFVYDAAKCGDKIAIDIIKNNMLEAAKFVKALAKDMNGKIPVVLAGGLTKDSMTIEFLKEALGNDDKYAVSVLFRAPVEGAVLLARKLYEKTEEN